MMRIMRLGRMIKNCQRLGEIRFLNLDLKRMILIFILLFVLTNLLNGLNNIIILRPNFFLYLTDAEQSAYIGLKLASLQAGEEFDVGGSDETFYHPKISSFQKISLGLTALGLLALYHNPIKDKLKMAWPVCKIILLSKGAALVAGCVAANAARGLLNQHGEIKKLSAAQYAVIDKLGSEGILSISEKQVHWGYRNHSWVVNKWNYLLGKFSLVYNPENDLELIKEYIAGKETQK